MHNTQHIRSIPITAENFLCNQISKHTKTDPLDAILDHIQRHPPPHTTKNIPNERANSNTILDSQRDKQYTRH